MVKDFSNLRHEDGEGGGILQKSGDTTKFSHKKIRIFSYKSFGTKISRYNQRPGDSSSLRYPQAKQTDPNLIFDPSFVRRIDQSGFIAGLYKK